MIFILILFSIALPPAGVPVLIAYIAWTFLIAPLLSVYLTIRESK
jgi:hypothetical protein